MEEILGGKVVIVSGNGNNETEKKIKEGIIKEAQDLNRIEFSTKGEKK